jgi:hypothetical protein
MGRRLYGLTAERTAFVTTRRGDSSLRYRATQKDLPLRESLLHHELPRLAVIAFGDSSALVSLTSAGLPQIMTRS